MCVCVGGGVTAVGSRGGDGSPAGVGMVVELSRPETFTLGVWSMSQQFSFCLKLFLSLFFSSLSYFCTKPEFMGGYLHEIGISYKRRLEMLQFECGIIHSDEVTL